MRLAIDGRARQGVLQRARSAQNSIANKLIFKQLPINGDLNRWGLEFRHSLHYVLLGLLANE
jgi:hypothetical protein